MSRADLFPTTSTPVALPAEERVRIEAEIQAHLDAAEALIGRLDATEPDADLEPSLGSLDRIGTIYQRGGPDQTYWSAGSRDDLELDPADDEPSLGWSAGIDQARAFRQCVGLTEDLEQEHDGREPDVDDEPSLGSMHGIDQRDWGWGDDSDAEEQCEDEGACETALDVL